MNITMQVGNELRSIDTENLPFSYKYSMGNLTIQKFEDGFFTLKQGEKDFQVSCDVPLMNEDAVSDIFLRASNTLTVPAAINALHFGMVALFQNLQQQVNTLKHPVVEEPKEEEVSVESKVTN